MNADGCGLMFTPDQMKRGQDLIQHCQIAMDIARAVKCVTVEIPAIANIGQRKAKAKQYNDNNKKNRWGASVNRRLALLIRGSLPEAQGTEDGNTGKKEDGKAEGELFA